MVLSDQRATSDDSKKQCICCTVDKMQTLLIFVVYLLASTLAANTEHTIQTHFGNITGLSVTNDGVQVLIFLGESTAQREW